MESFILIFITMVWPLLGIAAGIGLIIYGIWRKAHQKSVRKFFIMSVICFVIASVPYTALPVLDFFGGFPAAS